MESRGNMKVDLWSLASRDILQGMCKASGEKARFLPSLAETNLTTRSSQRGQPNT